MSNAAKARQPVAIFFDDTTPEKFPGRPAISRG